MRIGVITYWDSTDNYGQQLQCYALQTLLKSWGHDCFLIRYSPNMRTKSLWHKIVEHAKHPKYILKHLPISTSRKVSAQLEHKLRIDNERKNQLRKFEEFRSEHLQMTEQIYTSYLELCSNPPNADVYITGSDQVWHNPYKESASKGMFLQFGSKNAKRVSYAASIGRELTKREKILLRKFLSSFNSISVREESVQSLCKSIGYHAVVTLDPTLLLEPKTYRKIESTIVVQRPYVLFYILNVKTQEEISCLSSK